MKKYFYLLCFLSFLFQTALAGTFTEHHFIFCGSILELGPVGYPTWIEAKVIQQPKHGQAYVFTTAPYPDSLVYKSKYGYLGQDTFIVECAHATQITCDTGIYIISVIGCPPISLFTDTFEIACDSTLVIPGLGYPFWVIPEILQAPAHGEAQLVLVDSAVLYALKYTPDPIFTGTDTILVECAHATQVTCETGLFIIHVSCLNGTGEQQPPSLKIFPNPVNGVLWIQSERIVGQARLWSSQGALLMEVVSGAASLDIEMGNLPAGIYFLEIRLNGERLVQKVVRK
jgi:hypothetical protein